MGLEEATRQAENSEGDGLEKELEKLDTNDIIEDEENFCAACNKQCKNEKAYKQHLKQKKHLENVELLKELLADEDNELSEDLKSAIEKCDREIADDEPEVSGGEEESIS